MSEKTVLEQQSFTGYAVKVPHFEGPLDLLLYLVRNYEINIYDIPITLITEQFLGYLKLLQRMDLNVASEFIVMAAHLLYIKSRMLLPVDPELDDEEDPRTELVEQLLEYQKFKDAARLLEEAEAMTQEALERKPNQMVFEFPDDGENWVDVKLFDLVNAFSRLMAKGEKADPYFHVLDDVEEHYDSEEKIEQIRVLLDVKGQILFQELVDVTTRRGEIIIFFLALLHMIKRGIVVVKQHRLFGDIHVFLKARFAELARETEGGEGDAGGPDGAVTDNPEPTNPGAAT